MLHEIWQQLRTSLVQNQFLSGGLIIGLAGSLIAFARNLPGRLWVHVLAHFTTTVDIASDDPLYGWLKSWIAAQPLSRRTGLLSASSAALPVGSCAPAKDPMAPPEIVFTPAPGTYWLRYNGWPVRITRERKEHTTKDGWPTFRETMTFRFLCRDRELPRRLFTEARDLAVVPGHNARIWVPQYESWMSLGMVSERALDSIVLPVGLADAIVGALERFLESRGRYETLGVPYHFGVLLYGPPGSGKTSFIRALAGRFGFDVCLLSLHSDCGSSQRLRTLLSSLPSRPFVVIEDIDRDDIVNETKQAGILEQHPRLSLADVLNAFDGIATPQGMILVLTANHPERIDPALRRPGRIDREFAFTAATPEMIEQLFLRFFPGQLAAAARFMGLAGKQGNDLSMATLQELLFRAGDDAGLAVRLLADTASLVPIPFVPATVARNGHARSSRVVDAGCANV